MDALTLVAIDPGQKGAIAWKRPDSGTYYVTPMPEGRAAIVSLLGRLIKISGIAAFLIEAVSARPGQGVCSMFTFGRHLGTIEGALSVWRPWVFYLAPRVWMKKIGVRGKKNDNLKSGRTAREFLEEIVALDPMPKKALEDALCMLWVAEYGSIIGGRS